MRNNIIQRSLAITAILLTLIVAGYAQGNANIGSVKWKLTQANGKAVTNSLAYIQLSADRTKFTGNTGCNQMNGPVTIKGHGIDFGNIATTRRACKLMEGNVSEEEFLEALDKSSRFNRNGNTLSLLDRKGRTILRFEIMRDDKPNASTDGLGGNKWSLDSLGARMRPMAIRGVFINFDPVKGGVGGDTGCNVFGGDYTLTGKKIKISNAISTMRACEEDNKMAIEREFLDGLQNADRYELANNYLQLFRGSELLMSFRGEPK